MVILQLLLQDDFKTDILRKFEISYKEFKMLLGMIGAIAGAIYGAKQPPIVTSSENSSDHQDSLNNIDDPQAQGFDFGYICLYGALGVTAGLLVETIIL
ncbi:MAG: hypothetical protein K0R02_44 [Rickettsiaceae bacterium]|jgi:hypothetical protein|nr:hypothetical protein [Rickettsiaceae bacterium]